MPVPDQPERFYDNPGHKFLLVTRVTNSGVDEGVRLEIVTLGYGHAAITIPAELVEVVCQSILEARPW